MSAAEGEAAAKTASGGASVHRRSSNADKGKRRAGSSSSKKGAWSHLKAQPVPLPNRSDQVKNRLAFIVDGVLSPEECKEWIERAESANEWETAQVNVGGGRQKLLTDLRNNDRWMLDDAELADTVFQRIKHLVPAKFGDNGSYTLVELNERLRHLRYYPGTYFGPHFDGSFRRDQNSGYPPEHVKYGHVSLVTFQLYLNDLEPEDGGSTRFLKSFSGDDGFDCIPKAGRVLIFEHRLLHQGSMLAKGVKYCVRSDFMYVRTANG